MVASPLSPLMACALVACGGAVGSAARYALGHLTGRALVSLFGDEAYGWSILAVNLLGCLAMGLLFGWLAARDGGTETQRLLLAVGVLGGFTTFSAFSLEIVLLIQRGATGLALAYIAASVLGGVAALYLGLILSRGAA